MRIGSLSAVAGGLMLATAQLASAATVSGGQGIITVNGGAAVRGTVTVRAGDSVTARSGQTVIDYENGCSVVVTQGMTVTVLMANQCQQSYAGIGGGAFLAPVIGLAAGAGIIYGASRSGRGNPSSP